MRRRGFTLVEVLVGLGLVTVVLGIIYGLFHFLFASKSRSNLPGLTRRSFIQKDAKSGVRRLTYRLREATQILSPAPGTMSEELVFCDIQNNTIRLKRIASENRVISEKQVGGAWVRETDPATVSAGGTTFPVSWPVSVQSCTAIRFTPISGGSVIIEASLENEKVVGTFLTLVKLRNTGKAI